MRSAQAEIRGLSASMLAGRAAGAIRSSLAATALAMRLSRSTGHGSWQSQISWRRLTNCAARVSSAGARRSAVMQTCCSNYATALAKGLLNPHPQQPQPPPGCPSTCEGRALSTAAQRREAERPQCCRSLRPILLAPNLAMSHLASRLPLLYERGVPVALAPTRGQRDRTAQRKRTHGKRRDTEQPAPWIQAYEFAHIPARRIHRIPARFHVAGPNRSASPEFTELSKPTNKQPAWEAGCISAETGISRGIAITRFLQNRRFCKSDSCDGRTRADFRPIRAVALQPERREPSCYSTIYRP